MKSPRTTPHRFGTAPGSHPRTDLDEPLRRRLRERLLSLNYHAFARCMALLLIRMGYEDVRLAGRTDWKGKNKEGGYDLEANLPVGPGGALGRRRVLVQVKQFDTHQAVHHRTVDQLRGACLRVGAGECLLVTTEPLAPSVDRSPLRLFEPTVAPVRFLPDDALLERMLVHRVGVFEEPGDSPDKPARYGVDEAFFDGLECNHAGNSREEASKQATDLRLLVTVQVRSLGKAMPVKSRRTNPASQGNLANPSSR
jgi:hypothetical protein